MWRVISAVVLVVLAVAGAYVWWVFEIQWQYENGQLVYVKLVRRSARTAPEAPWQAAGLPPARKAQPTIRLASFNLERLDEQKLGNRLATDALVRVLPQFEVVALQGLYGETQGVLVRLVEQLNAATQRQYGYAVGPPSPRDATDGYSALLFDLTAVEVDRRTVQVVEDAAGRFRHPPLVAGFRVRGPGEAEAFTFTLINVHVAPERAAGELDLLDDVYRAVRDDGRNEDDMIMLGDFATDEAHLGPLRAIPDLTAAITAMPTTVRGTRRVDNILFERRATVEFTGRSGVLDLMRQCELTAEEAREISEHLPVWAEFSSYEGGQPGT